MARYVAYFRVSTEKQGKSGLGLAAQHGEGMSRRHAGQLDRAERPEVVHLEDQPRPGLARAGCAWAA